MTSSARPSSDIRKWISLLDDGIRSGRIKKVQLELLQYQRDRKLSSTPKALLVEIAALCRRCRMHELSVRILNPIVRGPEASRRKFSGGTEQERMEYAAALVQIGLEAEGDELLRSIDPDRYPLSLQFRAFACFTRWDYGAAVPLLRRQLAHPDIDSYQRLVARVNFVSALVGSRLWEEAEHEWSSLISEAEKAGNKLLVGNLLQIGANLYLSGRNLARGSGVLERAEEFFQETGSVDWMLVRKWRGVHELLRGGAAARARGLRILGEVRGIAADRGVSETVRDCDFQRAQVLEEEDLLRRLWFGTPFPGYRTRLKEFAAYVPDSTVRSFDWECSGDSSEGGKNTVEFLDIATASLVGKRRRKRQILKPGQIPHRLLAALSQDFYRTLKLPALHGAVFPGQHFNPVSSPNVLHQAMRRLRAQLAHSAPDIVIDERHGAYRLQRQPGGSLLIRIPRSIREVAEAGTPSRESGQRLRIEALLGPIRQALGASEFSRSELERSAALPGRSAGRLLEEAIKAGLLERLGAGPATRYRFIKVQGA